MTDEHNTDKLIDGYRDFVKLGTGGFAIVYRAHQERFDRQVAVKVLTIHLDEKALQRFERECHATGRLSGHPNVVTVFDSGVTNHGEPYMTTELMERGSLGDWLDRNGPMPLADVLAIGVKIAGALEAAHAADILHRDIKPENILVSGYGEPALADFGISAVGLGTNLTAHTMSFTPEQTAPEVLEGHPPAVTMDVYSLGSTLYTLLGAQPPFIADEDEGLLPFIRRLTHEPVPALPDERAPRDVMAVLSKSMSKNPDGRYQSASELGEALQGLQAAHGQPVTPILASAPEGEIGTSPIASLLRTTAATTAITARPPASPGRRAGLAAVAVAAVMALIGVGLALGRSSGTNVDTAGSPVTAAPTAFNPATPVPGGTLRIAVAGANPSFRPLQIESNVRAYDLLRAVWEPLVRIGESHTPEPYLAESVIPNDDFTSWTIALRAGVTFHDGTKLDAEAVLSNLEQFRKNPLAAKALAPIETIDAVDERTVRVTMSKPWAHFDAALAAAGSEIVSQAKTALPAGTGPFLAPDERQASEQVIELRKNPSYWSERKPFVDAIRLEFSGDNQARMQALEKGEVDLAFMQDTSTIAREREHWPTIFDQSVFVNFVSLNTSKPPLNKAPAREALVLATNTEQIRGRQPLLGPTSGPFGLDSPWLPDNLPTPAYDRDRAHAIAKQSFGQNEGKSLELQTILGGTGQGNIAVALQNMWQDKSALGIDVKPKAVAFRELSATLVQGNYQATLYFLVVPRDPDLFLYNFFYSDSSAVGLNFSKLNDPEVDRLIDASRATRSIEERKRLYGLLLERLYKLNSGVWLFSEPMAVFAGPRVTGLSAGNDAGLLSGAQAWPLLIGVQ